MTHNILTFIVGGAIALVLMLRYCLPRSTTVSRARLDRAINGMKKPSVSTDNLPSIIRVRHTSFGGKEKLRTIFFGPIIQLNQSLEFLGVQIPLAQGAVFVLLFSLFSGYCIHILLHLTFIVSFTISLVLLIFIIYVYIGMAKNRIGSKFQHFFPDALDLVVRSVRAGLPVSEAIKMISAEVPNPVGSAFREVGSNISIGISLNDALNQLAAKIPIAELRFFAISLAVQQETGGNLAEILSNLSKLMRKRVNVKKKIRALSSEARASALIIGSLPFIVGAVIFSFNPSYMEVLFYEEDGQFLILCALASIATGGTIMAKLIRFKI